MCYRDRASLRDTTSRKREILFFPVAREKCQRPLTQIRLWPKKARIKLINYTGSSPSVGSRPNCLDFRDPDIYFSPMSRMLRLREREFPVDTKDNLNVLLSERTYRGKFSIVHLSGQDPYSPWDMVSRYHRDPRFLLSQTNSGNWLWKVIFIRYRGGEGHFLPRHLFFFNCRARLFVSGSFTLYLLRRGESRNEMYLVSAKSCKRRNDNKKG